MWLARSLPPLLSHLRRPASAHHGGSLLLAGTSSRAYTSAGGAPVAAGTWPPPQLCNCCGANPQRRRRHLYLPLDDWEKGFSLYELSLEDLIGSRDDDAGVEPQCLPDPILRLPFVMVGSHPRFHALGTNIVLTSDWDHFGVRNEHGPGLTLVYDTDTAALENENSLPRELFGHYHAVAAGNKLCTFSPSSDGGMLYLCQTKCGIRVSGDDEDVPYGLGYEDEDVSYSMRPQERWTWKSGPLPPPPLSTRDDLQSYVSAYALHPDGRTIFVSVNSRIYGCGKEGTFSLDMESGSAWMRHGDWHLPFKGQAHYDGDLGAWVGTHMVRGYEHLCAFDVPEIGEGAAMPCPAPAWKVAEKRLTFLENPPKSMYDSPVIIPMGCTGDDVGGRGGMFCLLERTFPQGEALRPYMRDGEKSGSLLRVTIFRSRYDKNGELVSVPLWPGRSYLVSRYVPNYDVSAFWI